MLETILAYLVQYGLVGLFSGSFILSLVFFPGFVEALVVSFLAFNFNPFLVLLFATAGSVAGGFVNYFMGYYGSKFIRKDIEKRLKSVEKWFGRWGDLTVFVTSFIPFFPFDLFAVAMGVLELDRRHFLISMFLGKLVKFSIIIFGFEGLSRLGSYFGFF